jgi:hypothetical protein
MNRDEFAVLLHHAGLDVAPATVDELYRFYGDIEAMIERVHASEDEPMLAFAPLELPS